MGAAGPQAQPTDHPRWTRERYQLPSSATIQVRIAALSAACAGVARALLVNSCDHPASRFSTTSGGTLIRLGRLSIDKLDVVI